MDKKSSKLLWIGTALAAGFGAIITLIAASGEIPKWSVVALGILGGVSFSGAVVALGWIRAPHALGTSVRAIIILIGIWAAMIVLGRAVWPVHTKAFVQIETPEILQQYSFIVPRKEWGGNIHSTNPGPDRVFDLYGFSKAYVEDAGDDADKKVIAKFNKEIEEEWKGYLAGTLKGVPVASVGQGSWGTALTEPLSQKQCDGISDGSLRIYILSRCIWKDSQGNTDTAFDCRWLQALPKRAYRKNEIIWHYCQQ